MELYFFWCFFMKLIVVVGKDGFDELREISKNPFKSKEYAGAHTTFIKDVGQLVQVLAPKRLELMAEIVEKYRTEGSIGELAESLHRKQEAISRDAIVLQKHGLIQKVKNKRQVCLKPKFDSIEIRFKK